VKNKVKIYLKQLFLPKEPDNHYKVVKLKGTTEWSIDEEVSQEEVDSMISDGYIVTIS